MEKKKRKLNEKEVVYIVGAYPKLAKLITMTIQDKNINTGKLDDDIWEAYEILVEQSK
jgi:hypothetical protein